MWQEHIYNIWAKGSEEIPQHWLGKKEVGEKEAAAA